ncbi:MAG: glycine zipper 2TM domain-containing protein [Parcubacteria group bacterium]|nr:glycine zipper 2TM domain-containing protein [Parcubacteria group bacterium]
MKAILSVGLVFALMISVSACQSNGWGNKQTGGMLIGGAIGGLAGSQIGSGKGQLAATALGVLLGAWAGSEVGASLDRADRMYAERAAMVALETNPTRVGTPWHNPDSGHSGMIMPTRTYQTSSGEYCREYQQEVTVGGKKVRAYGTACRNPDGSWRIVN